MSKDLYAIGEVSKLMNISIKALRNYDSLGLLKPYHIDEKSRYRYYKYDQLFYIDLIRYMNKELQVPLEEIGRLLNLADNHAELLDCLVKHNEAIEQKLNRMERSHKLLNEAIENLKRRKTSTADFYLYEQYLLSRYVVVKDVDVSIHDIDLFCRLNEEMFADFSEIEGNYMCYVYYKKFHDPENPALFISQIGTFTNTMPKNQKYITLPEGRYLCCRFRHSEERAYEATARLQAFARQNNIPLSDTAVQIFNRFDLKAWNKYDYEMELQVLEK